MADPFKLLLYGKDFHLVMNLAGQSLCGIGREKLKKLPPRERTIVTQGNFPSINDSRPSPTITEFTDWTVTCKECEKEAMKVW